MKNILLSICFLTLLYWCMPPAETSEAENLCSRQEVVGKDKTYDIQHQLEVISQDLRDSNGLTARRHITPFQFSCHSRIVKNAFRHMHEIKVKEENTLQKISESEIVCQTSKRLSLLSERGYHIYALRKLLI